MINLQKYFYSISSFLLLIVVPTISNAERTVETRPQWTKPDSIYFATPAECTILFPLEQGSSYRLLSADTAVTNSDSTPKPTKMELLSVKEDTLQEAGTQQYRFRITAIAFSDSNVVFPSLLFLLTKNGTSETLRVAEYPVSIISLPVDTTAQFRDIKPLEEIPVTWDEYLTEIILGVLVLAMGIGGWWWWRKRKQAPQVQEIIVVPKLSPDEEALEALRNLEHEQLWQAGKVKQYYTRITEIIRRYCERRYQFSAQELTSDELLAALQAYHLPQQATELLSYLVRLADLVKFAKATTQPEENKQALQWAITFVEQTRRPELRQQTEQGGNNHA